MKKPTRHKNDWVQDIAPAWDEPGSLRGYVEDLESDRSMVEKQRTAFDRKMYAGLTDAINVVQARIDEVRAVKQENP